MPRNSDVLPKTSANKRSSKDETTRDKKHEVDVKDENVHPAVAALVVARPHDRTLAPVTAAVAARVVADHRRTHHRQYRDRRLHQEKLVVDLNSAMMIDRLVPVIAMIIGGLLVGERTIGDEGIHHRGHRQNQSHRIVVGVPAVAVREARDAQRRQNDHVLLKKKFTNGGGIGLIRWDPTLIDVIENAQMIWRFLSEIPSMIENRKKDAMNRTMLIVLLGMSQRRNRRTETAKWQRPKKLLKRSAIFVAMPMVSGIVVVVGMMNPPPPPPVGPRRVDRDPIPVRRHRRPIQLVEVIVIPIECDSYTLP